MVKILQAALPVAGEMQMEYENDWYHGKQGKKSPFTTSSCDLRSNSVYLLLKDNWDNVALKIAQLFTP